MKKILVINGPNLNLLGTREKEVYGSFTLEQIQNHTQEKLKRENVSLDWFQSNLEGEIIDRLHKSLKQNYLGIVINPAGYSHTSVAILDALKIMKIPIVEVHLSNVYRREEFRQTMLTAQAASMIMGGLGIEAYYMGVLALLNNEEK
jgi:3-dehydroquinate dehydratase-2